jgi:hypothetical protein
VDAFIVALPSARVAAHFDQQSPLGHSLFEIEFEHGGGRSAYIGERRDQRSSHPKVVIPDIAPRVEEPNDSACSGIRRPDVGSFPGIATQTGEREIFGFRNPAIVYG